MVTTNTEIIQKEFAIKQFDAWDSLNVISFVAYCANATNVYYIFVETKHADRETKERMNTA